MMKMVSRKIVVIIVLQIGLQGVQYAIRLVKSLGFEP